MEDNYIVRSAKTFTRPPLQNLQNKAKCRVIVFTIWDHICLIVVITYGRIILRGIFRKWEGAVGTGWSGLRIGTGGGHL
jgi:hypothetical protein